MDNELTATKSFSDSLPKIIKFPVLFILEFLYTILKVSKVLLIYSLIPALLISFPLIATLTWGSNIIYLGSYPLILLLYKKYITSNFYKHCC